MEQMGQNNSLEYRNDMQIKLAERHHEDLMDFITNHSKDFGNYFDEHPDLIKRYEVDEEGVLRELEKVVYH